MEVWKGFEDVKEEFLSEIREDLESIHVFG